MRQREKASSISYKDLMTALNGVVAAALLFAIPFINIPSKDNPDATKPPGDIMACIEWQGPHDVDLWATSPEQKIATGYANKNGETLDLVRDDLGNDPKVIVHRECQFARGLPDGRWVFNIHGYSIRDKNVKVHSEITIGSDGNFVILDERDLVINQQEEITIVQFRLQNGRLVPGSKNIVNTKLRSNG